MKEISTLEELNSHVEANPMHLLDAETGVKVPLEVVEMHVMAGKRLLVLETEQDMKSDGEAALGALCRRIAKKKGWKAAARHLLSLTGNMLTGRKLVGYARHLRKKYAR